MNNKVDLIDNKVPLSERTVRYRNLHMLNTRTFEEQCSSEFTIKNWGTDIKRGRTDFSKEYPAGKRVFVSTRENVEAVHEMILENR